MTSAVTLEVSEAIMRRVQEVAQQTGRPIEVILQEWLELGAVFVTEGAEYHIYTPFFDENGDAARSLQAMLDAAKGQAKEKP